MKMSLYAYASAGDVISVESMAGMNGQRPVVQIASPDFGPVASLTLANREQAAVLRDLLAAWLSATASNVVPLPARTVAPEPPSAA